MATTNGPVVALACTEFEKNIWKPSLCRHCCKPKDCHGPEDDNFPVSPSPNKLWPPLQQQEVSLEPVSASLETSTHSPMGLTPTKYVNFIPKPSVPISPTHYQLLSKPSTPLQSPIKLVFDSPSLKQQEQQQQQQQPQSCTPQQHTPEKMPTMKTITTTKLDLNQLSPNPSGSGGSPSPASTGASGNCSINNSAERKSKRSSMSITISTSRSSSSLVPDTDNITSTSTSISILSKETSTDSLLATTMMTTTSMPLESADQPLITKTTTTTTQLNIPANFDNAPTILNLTLSNNTTTEIIDDEDDPFKDFDDLSDGPKTITTTTISTTKEAEGKTETSTSSTTTILCLSPRAGASPSSCRVMPVSPSTNIRKQLCMANDQESEDDWDQGVDLSSFLRHKKNLKDFNYCSNKIMEISSVQLEAQRQSVDFGGSIHPHAFQAFKEILQAKETQIRKAMKTKKIDEKDCLMLIEHLESVTEVLDKLLLGNSSEQSDIASSSIDTATNTTSTEVTV